ncbi:MAG: choice-of-anchor D domain-containing protein [Myxococcaceae bacterium]
MRALLATTLMLLAACIDTPPADAGVDAGPDEVDAGSNVSVVSLAFNGDFGAVQLGSNATRTAVMKNEGPNTVKLFAFATSSIDFSVSSAVPPRLEPGETLQVVVTAYTSRLGLLSGELRFGLDGVQQVVPLSAEVAGPQLDLSTDTVDFPLVGVFDTVAGSAEQRLEVRNSGRSTFPPTIDSTLELTVVGITQLSGDPATLCVLDCQSQTLRVVPQVARELPVKVSADTPGERTWSVTLATTDLLHPLVTLSVRAVFQRLPLCQFTLVPTVDFGAVAPGEARETEVVFENSGTEDCTVSTMGLDQPTFPTSAFTATASVPATIRPGGFLRVTVGVQPADGLPDFQLLGKLALGVNAPTGFATVDLRARALMGSCLAVTPSRLDFGEVRAGCSSEWKTVWVANHCGDPLAVTAVRSLHPLFEVADAGGFDPGLGTPVQVRFLPGATGAEAGLLSIDWASPAMALNTVELRGTGSSQASHVQRFPPRSSVDVLLAIDDSPSMLARQTVLDAQLPQLLSALLQNGADFSLAVVTANDGPALGRLRFANNGEWVINPSTANPQLRFSELTRVQGQGGARSCAKAALWAMTAPWLGLPRNVFRRPGAPLVVVCISDGPESDAFFVPQVLTLSDRVTWHAIAPIDAQTGAMNCGLISRPASYFDSHHALPEATGGLREDFCSPGWSRVLGPTASVPQMGPRFLRLDGHPDLSMPDLQVAVNGTVLSTGWSYDAGVNVVLLDAAPGGTARVDLQWSAACNP